MLLESFCIFILCLPTLYAVWEDRNGDVHPNNDLVIITLIGLVAASCVGLMRGNSFWNDNFKGAFLSFCIFVSIFPYLMNIVHLKRGVTYNKVWWNHLSKTAWPDRLPTWRNLHWTLRMLFYALVLFTGIITYFTTNASL